MGLFPLALIVTHLPITNAVSLPLSEVEMTAIRSQGAGGQNVNKVATAIHLRFDIPASSLPDRYKERLLQLNDRRITQEGVWVLKVQEHRTQEQNREEALLRLQTFIRSVSTLPKARKPTRPSKGAKERRLEGKSRRSETKANRRKVDD